MRISDWSSDVCSSDLVSRGRAIYGSLGYEITPAFNVTAELRWTHEKQKFNGVGASEFYNGTRIVGDQSFSYWTPRFTANYELQPDLDRKSTRLNSSH